MSVLWTRSLIVLGAAIVLAAVKLSIHSKERTIAQGETIFLELMPVDPRSLMQGDYMALRFRLAEEIERARQRGTLAPSARTAPLAIDAHRVATLAQDTEADAQIRFRIRNRSVWIGTNAFFFEEGSSSKYVNARYGELRLERGSGQAVLVGLRDAQFNEL